MRDLMTAPQNDEIRRQIYHSFAQPILSTLISNIQSYFEQVYRIVPRRSREQVRNDALIACSHLIGRHQHCNMLGLRDL